MIDPNDKNIKWTLRANLDMTLLSMIDMLYKLELTEGYGERYDRHQPWNHYRKLYEDHKDLLNDIVEIFFPDLVFIPSNINQPKTNEFYMFTVINAIFYIVWYNNIEESSPRGYEKESRGLDNARYYLSRYLNITDLNNLINYPSHRNENLEQLNDFFIDIKRVQQGQKILNAIKKYFGIDTITATREKKMVNANKKVLDKIKSDHNFTDEEVKRIPILGQLQTKI